MRYHLATWEGSVGYLKDRGVSIIGEVMQLSDSTEKENTQFEFCRTPIMLALVIDVQLS